MSNPNIVPRKFTKEESSRGGRAVSIYRGLARSLVSRKECSVRCMYFVDCPVSAMSFGSPDKKCLMREFPETVRKQFINLFLTGEEGIIRQLKVALHNYMNDVEAYGTIHDKRDMVQLILNIYDKIYNNPKKMAGKKEPLTITIRRVGMEPQTVLVNPREPEPVRKLIAPVDVEDPESLINSPILDTLILPKSRPLYMEEIKIESNMETILDEDDEA